MVMHIVSYTDARNNLKEVLDRVNETDEVIVISRKNSEHAVVMSLDHYNGLIETAYLMSNPANVAKLFESISQLKEIKNE